MKLTIKNFRQAQKFLDRFDYGYTTLQLMQDKKQKFTGGKKLWNGDEGSSVAAFEGPMLDHKDLITDIAHLQTQGFSLWFMVNEGDGDKKPGNKTERSQENVIALTACFIDTDQGDPKKIHAFSKAHSCPPSAIVNTSPGKYHYYWFLEKIEATADNILKWEAIQHALMAIDKRFDRTMADHSRVLRVPFFYHNKKEPYLINIEKINDTYYDLDDLYELVGADRFMKINGQGDRFEYPTTKIESGNRHYSLVAYLRSLTAKGIYDQNLLLNAGIGFARQHFSDFKIYMPGGERFDQLEHNVESCLEYARQEQTEKLLDHLEDQKEARSALTLPPSFFTNDCPNEMIGEMVKHSMSVAKYPSAAYDFAGIVAMCGLLKSHIVVSADRHAPSNYFLCVGRAGRGKNHIQMMVDNALGALHERVCLEKRLKTEKGLYRALYEGNSRLLVLTDEIEQILSLITKGGANVESYTKALKPALLTLYSHTDMFFKSARTGNEKDKVYEFDKPHLNVIGFGTMTALTKGFTLDSIRDGLLPRFLVVADNERRKFNDDARGKLPQFTRDHLDYLRRVVMRGKCRLEEDMLQIADLQEEAEELRSKPGNKSREERERLSQISEELNELNSKGRVVGKAAVLPFTKQAWALYERMIKTQDDKINELADRESPLTELYSRSVEKAGRLAIVLAEEKVESKHLEYAWEFVWKQQEALATLIGENAENLESGLSWAERRYRVIKKLLENNPEGLSRTEVSRNTRISGKELTDLLSVGTERGEIKIIHSGKGKARKELIQAHFRI